MKTADVKIGQQYYATVSGGRVRVTVLESRERQGFRKGIVFRCQNERTGREVFKTARQLTPITRERAPGMDDAAVRILMRAAFPKVDRALVDAVLPPVTVIPQLETKPVVVGYTTDGLPLVSTDCPAHGTLCADAHCGRREETPAERHARIYADAMNH